MVDQCHSIFFGLPTKYTSPIGKDDHQEFNTSEEFPIQGVQHYESLMGTFNEPFPLFDMICIAHLWLWEDSLLHLDKVTLTVFNAIWIRPATKAAKEMEPEFVAVYALTIVKHPGADCAFIEKIAE
jgi:hypothetical protein